MVGNSTYYSLGGCDTGLMTEVSVRDPEKAKLTRIETRTSADGSVLHTFVIPVGTELDIRAYPMDNGAESGGLYNLLKSGLKITSLLICTFLKRKPALLREEVV